MTENITILLIDDEPSNIQIIYNILLNSKSNFKILSASSSVLGLEIALKTKPDIIISDWEMPELSGIDIINRLHKNEETIEIPVIITTGIKMSSFDLKYALDNGAFDFIRKPIEENELLARINSTLRILDYYKEKNESNKTLEKLKSEKLNHEIDAKKREILAKTLLLIKINKLNLSFKDELKKIKYSECKNSCTIFNQASSFTDDLFINGKEKVWNELENNFEQINDQFYKNLCEKFPFITKNDKKLCAFLRLNLTSKEISSITLQTIRSIEIARTRLREKLGLKGSEKDLHSFLLNF